MTRISDSRKSPDSRESCESIRANHATKKEPLRTKNTTTIANIVNYYAVVFLLRPPYSLHRRPFFEKEKCL